MFQYRVSESVCAGHPDKLADQISDAILDAAIAQDPYSRVAIETLLARNTIVVAGEMTTKANINTEEIARETVKRNGYIYPEWGFSNKSRFIHIVHEQSPEIALGVEAKGAGDQGLMYGYATNETDEFLPLSAVLAHAICRSIDTARTSRSLSYLRPDGKAQVVLAYKNGVAHAIKHITVAVPHNEDTTLQEVNKDITRKLIEPLCERYSFKIPKDIIINGTGVWHMPGPASDVGLTGRKIVIDTYGGHAKIGGGAFSGKDPSKVDRSGAYAARFIAKNIVAHGLADRAEVCLAFYIGAQNPIIKTIYTFGTAHYQQKYIRQFANTLLDCSVAGIIDTLSLRQPMYSKTSVYGHFGRAEFPWEQIITM